MKRNRINPGDNIISQCLGRSIAVGMMCAFVVMVMFFTITPATANETESHDEVSNNDRSDLITINQSQQGNLLFRTSHRHLYRQAPVLNTDVEMDITAMTARVRVTQTFHNEGQDWVEGVYVFPLPENASVDHMRMLIGDRVLEGKIKERKEAKRIYEKAKSSGKKAALIEQERPNLFTNSVANIGPDEKIQITIEYQQSLAYVDRTFSIRFPMTVTPRYIPGKPLPAMEETFQGSAGSGWSLNTTQVSDASRITPPILDEGDGYVNPVSMTINLNAGIELSDIKSLHHPVGITQGKNGKAKIYLRSESVPADRDFVLQWQPVLSQAPRAALFNEHKKDGENNSAYYSLMMIMPPTDKIQQTLAREVVFIIDTSGSMGGESIRQARSALLMAIKRLKPSDRFNVIEFNSITRPLFSQPVIASHDNINYALQRVSTLQAGGGTEMASALNLALSYPVNKQYLQQIVFLTDGAVGNERALFQIIHDKLDDVRLFTVGIGSAPNSFFMSKAAKFGRGTYTYIGNISEVAERMQTLFSKLETPVMRNLKLHWPDVMGKVETYPRRLPDLYAGEPLIINAKSTTLQGSVKITGERGRQPWSASFPLNSKATQPGVGVLWARNRVASLMDSLHEGADKDLVRSAVIKTALNHHLVSKYTSLVAVDVTPSRPTDQLLKKTSVPTNLPKGMQHGKISGVAMAQTATAAQLHLFIGLILLLLVGVYWRFSERLSSRRISGRISA